jgi:hypothetical protein
VDEKITHREILKLSIRNLSKGDQETFLHDPIVVTEETWPIVFETTGAKNFTMIGGDNYSLKIPETPPSDYQKWAMTLEYVPWYVFSIQGWLIQNDVDVRWAIPVLRSIKYLLRDNFDLKSRFYTDWEDYINNINSLCDNWFMFSSNEAMITLKLVLQFLDSLSCNHWSSLPPSTEFEFYLANRARLFNKHLEFLDRKRVDFGQAVTNFVYNPYLMKNKSVIGRTENRVSVILSELFTGVPLGQVWLNRIHMLMP